MTRYRLTLQSRLSPLISLYYPGINKIECPGGLGWSGPPTRLEPSRDSPLEAFDTFFTRIMLSHVYLRLSSHMHILRYHANTTRGCVAIVHTHVLKMLAQVDISTI